MDNYYNCISEGYDELHGQEQENKMRLISQEIDPGKDSYLLDVGAGTGLSSRWDCNVFCIDPNIGLLSRNPCTNKVIGYSENLPFPDDAFEYVISVSAIHNFSNAKKGLYEMIRVCRSDLIISILKRSKNFDDILYMIKEKTKVKKTIDDQKDLIVFSSISK